MGRRKIRPHGSESICGQLFAPPGIWTPPAAFPSLSGARDLGIDIESHDPHLNSRGPGFIRGDANVVGFSLSTGDRSWYFPFAHLSGGNLDKDVCIRFLADVAKQRSDRNWIGANLQYELEGLDSCGVTLQGKFIDVQIAEAVLDEEREEGYDLGTLSRIHLGTSKDETLLNEAALAYGVDPKRDLWKLHSKYVGTYAEIDAHNPIHIFAKQRELLEKNDLAAIFDMECELLPILWLMRKQGIPVDLARAKNLSVELKQQEDVLRDELKGLAGRHIDVRSGVDLAELCDRNSIWYPRTEKGNPSFVAKFLEESSHPVLQKINDVRVCENMRATFVDKWIFKNQINGIIHPQWKQLKSDDGGARTGRMAASNPNPQQVPSRNELAPLIRKVFRRKDDLPWAKLDYSQQEPRLMVHYAYLCGYKGASEWRDKYLSDPKLRIYGLIAKAANVPDRESKDLTLGRMYGMGLKKMAYKCACSVEKAQEYLGKLDNAVPFVKEIQEDTMRKAQQRGWIKTLCGRKRHFNYWEPANSYDLKQRGIDTLAVPFDQAEKKWPKERLQRAYTHKALNALIQGSAADMTKMAIIMGYREQGRIPYMAVHDELDGPVTDRLDAERWQHVAQTAVKCTVPIVAELHYGESWK